MHADRWHAWASAAIRKVGSPALKFVRLAGKVSPGRVWHDSVSIDDSVAALR